MQIRRRSRVGSTQSSELSGSRIPVNKYTHMHKCKHKQENHQVTTVVFFKSLREKEITQCMLIFIILTEYLLNICLERPLTSPSQTQPHCPHTQSRTPHPSPGTTSQLVHWTTGHPPERIKTLFVAIINKLSWKVSLFSPAQAQPHCPHIQSWDASSFSFTEAQRTQPGPLDHRTHTLNGLRLYGIVALINKLSWKFSPAQAQPYRPHTQYWDASPFTKAQRAKPSPLEHRTHP